MSSPQSSRIKALDGLRGLAIILVLLSHLRLGPLFALVPANMGWFFGAIPGSGKQGVALLFLLSGYLMGSIYKEVPSIFDFLQKRYSRIFPAFLAMTFSLGIIRHWWDTLPSWVVPLIVLACIIIPGQLWRLLQTQSQQRQRQVNKWVFCGILLFQLLVAIGYLALQFFVPPSVFYLLWPSWAFSLVNYLVNASMAMPLGTYVALLDGAHWSVFTEVFFYVLFPIIVLPLVQVAKKTSHQWKKFLGIALLFPATFSLFWLGQAALGIATMQLQLLIFCFVGVLVSQLDPKHIAIQLFRSKFAKVSPLLATVGTLAIIALPTWISSFKPLLFPVGTLLFFWSVPAAFLLILLTDPSSTLSRIFSHRALVFLGTISYSIYLTHTIAIELFVRSGPPSTLYQTGVLAGAALALTAVLSLVLHHQLELPYFRQPKNVPHRQAMPLIWRSFRGIALVFALILSALWVGFRVPSSLLSIVQSHAIPTLPSEMLVPGKDTTSFSITPTYNNLGQIVFDFKAITAENAANYNLSWKGGYQYPYQVSIEQNDTLLQTAAINPYILHRATFFPIGLPVQPDSAGKTYTISLSADPGESRSDLVLHNDGRSIRSVHLFSKQEVLAKPTILLNILLSKISQPFLEKTALRIFFYFAPFLIFAVYVTVSLAKKIGNRNT